MANYWAEEARKGIGSPTGETNVGEMVQGLQSPNMDSAGGVRGVASDADVALTLGVTASYQIGG